MTFESAMPTTEAVIAAKSLVAATASVAASVVLVRTVVHDLVPHSLYDYAAASLSHLFARFSSSDTIVIDENRGFARNYVYKAAEAYLASKLTRSTRRLRANMEEENDSLVEMSMDDGEEVVDVYEGKVTCRWRLFCIESQSNHMGFPFSNPPTERRYYELSFHRSHRDTVLSGYLPYVVDRWRAIKEAKKGIKIHSGVYTDIVMRMGHMQVWTAAKLDHPATFETLAMEPELKSAIMEDLRRFVRRKDYYRKVGKAWKRGYLLYGPPGTGKSSLIAAMANYLRFDIYDLDLSQVRNNSDLRTLLMATENKSLLVVEDIDCSVDLPNRVDEKINGGDYKDVIDPYEKKNQQKVTLSGLLNLVDGLWSSCGDERIIVFTTNYKDRLDPAMLRPGRMDMHIHMSYCTPAAFRVLASNYHAATDHRLFGEIDRLLGEVEVSPAELAEELLRSEEVDVALQRVVDLVEEKKKSTDGNQIANSSPN